MRRLLLAAALLAPLSAQAQDAFCNGLRQIVQAAAQDFVELPSGTHYLRGSVNERRAVAPPFDGAPPRAVYYAVMLRDDRRDQGHRLGSRHVASSSSGGPNRASILSLIWSRACR